MKVSKKVVRNYIYRGFNMDSYLQTGQNILLFSLDVQRTAPEPC